MKIIEVQVTFPDEVNAHQLAEHLISLKLAACANIIPIHSIYRWNNALQKEGEYLAYIKTSMGKVNELIAEIKSHHPYDIPAILYWEVDTTDDYSHWIHEQV